MMVFISLRGEPRSSHEISKMLSYPKETTMPLVLEISMEITARRAIANSHKQPKHMEKFLNCPLYLQCKVHSPCTLINIVMSPKDSQEIQFHHNNTKLNGPWCQCRPPVVHLTCKVELTQTHGISLTICLVPLLSNLGNLVCPPQGNSMPNQQSYMPQVSLTLIKLFVYVSHGKKWLYTRFELNIFNRGREIIL